MKTLSTLLFLCITAIFFAGCNNVTISSGDGSDKIEGNGKIVSEARETGTFSNISLEGVFNVVLAQGDKESVTVETDENILPVIVTVVENDTLKVRMKDSVSISRIGKLNVKIAVVSILHLNTVGVGSLRCSEPIHLKELDLNCKGVGKTELNLEADKLKVRSEIVGGLSLSGVVREVSIKHDGIGMIKAFDLRSEKMTLITGGVGGAEIFASKELTVEVSGVGGVKYKGGASKKQITNSGIGKVSCADCK